VTIAKGKSWGVPGALPQHGVIVSDDAEAGRVIEEARRHQRPIPPLGLLGGDLCRTLGGTGDRSRLRSAQAMTFPVDLGAVLLDGRLHWFVSHLVARSGLWRKAFVAMNAQWLGDWNLGPRAHPNDGLLDMYDASLTLGDLAKVHRRLRHGAQLPHPRITERRAAAFQITLGRPRPIVLDGIGVGSATNLSLRVEPDALFVVI
jgi:hypothetical protein